MIPNVGFKAFHSKYAAISTRFFVLEFLFLFKVLLVVSYKRGNKQTNHHLIISLIPTKLFKLSNYIHVLKFKFALLYQLKFTYTM